MSAQAQEPPAAAVAEVPRLAEHLFRHEAGRLVSVLTGIFGTERLQLAEDVVQEALIRALQVWPYQGVPKNPAAWLTQTAKHLALDFVRREKRFHEKESEIIAIIEQAATARADAFLLDSEIHDERLRLMFACCHPLIPAESQAALALKTICGFGPMEIASAFLASEAAIAKRLTRARQKIQELRIPFEIPSGPHLAERLDSVRQTLFLLFNEGYKASTGESLIREDLCAEAIRLATLLAAHPAGDEPRTHALLSLMLLNAARLPARLDSDGNILRLQEQDRSRWDQAMIASGIWHLGRSAVGDELSEYHLQAGIAACHATAADDASTDWPRILVLYDRLLEIDASPVVALNRAVAVARVRGPARGIEAVETLRERPEIATYYLLYAVLGELETQLGHDEIAAGHFRRALEFVELNSERKFLTRRLRDCEARLQQSPEEPHISLLRK